MSPLAILIMCVEEGRVLQLVCWHYRTSPQHESVFSSDTHQSMKTSDSDLKVNRNIYPDAVTCDRMRLIGPKTGQLGPINHCVLVGSQ